MKKLQSLDGIKSCCSREFANQLLKRRSTVRVMVGRQDERSPQHNGGGGLQFTKSFPVHTAPRLGVVENVRERNQKSVL